MLPLARVIIVAFALSLVACAAPQPFATSGAYTSPPPSKPVAFSGGDGSSVEQAIVVHTRDKLDSALAKYDYMRQRYGPYELEERFWIPVKERLYDKYELITRDGKKHVIHFDITQAFPASESKGI